MKKTIRQDCGCLCTFEISTTGKRQRGRPVLDYKFNLQPCPVHAHAQELAHSLKILWDAIEKIDNGRCMVCKEGFANYIPTYLGNTMIGVTHGPCSNPECLSHVIKGTLEKAGKVDL